MGVSHTSQVQAASGGASQSSGSAPSRQSSRYGSDEEGEFVEFYTGTNTNDADPLVDHLDPMNEHNSSSAGHKWRRAKKNGLLLRGIIIAVVFVAVIAMIVVVL